MIKCGTHMRDMSSIQSVARRYVAGINNHSRVRIRGNNIIASQRQQQVLVSSSLSSLSTIKLFSDHCDSSSSCDTGKQQQLSSSSANVATNNINTFTNILNKSSNSSLYFQSSTSWSNYHLHHHHDSNGIMSSLLSTRFVHSHTSTKTNSEPIIIPNNLKFDPKSLFNIIDNNNYNTSKETTIINKNRKNNRNNNNSNNNIKKPVVATTDTKEENSKEDDETNDEWYDDDENDENDPIDNIDEKLSMLVTDDIMYVKPLPDRLKVDIHTLFVPSQTSTQVGTIYLDETVFGCNPIRIDLMKRAVTYIRAKRRGKRNAHTKTISEVSGSGRKVRQQKGLGKARVGHSRPAHFRGGAKAHGPNKHYNTDYSNIKLNYKVRQMAIRNTLSQKLKENNLIVVNELYSLPTHKTKDLIQLLKPWNIASKDNNNDNSYTAFVLDHYYPEQEHQQEQQISQQEGEDDSSKSNDTTTKSNKDVVTTTSASAATSYYGIPINLYVASSNISYQFKVVNDLQLNVYDLLKYDKCIITLSALKQIEKRLKL